MENKSLAEYSDEETAALKMRLAMGALYQYRYTSWPLFDWEPLSDGQLLHAILTCGTERRRRFIIRRVQ